MKDTFLTNLEREGEIPSVRSEEEEKETPPASSTEDKPAVDQPESLPGKEGKDETPASEKDAKPEVFRAFHTHPTWVKTQSELKELRAFRERVEPLLANLDKVKEGVEKTVEIPEWFGGDEHLWKKYQAHQSEELKKLRQELLDEQQAQSRKSVEEQRKWESWVEEGILTIVSDADNVVRAKTIGFDLGNKEQAKAFRNELLKVAVDFKPTDEDNNISLLKALDILELQKLRKAPEKAVPDKRKEIADKTIQKGKSEGSEKGYKNSADLRNKSFRDLIPDLE